MNPSSSRNLQVALTRGNNNFDLLRLLAALMVIVGHAHALARVPTSSDLISEWLRFDYSGSLAVKFFFFLSGLLVANSLIEKPDLVQFVANRALRILPGLFACLLVTTSVVGALFTTLPLGQYLRHPETLRYFVDNLVLTNMRFRLPGVFEWSKFGVNGSLWTLPFEVRCYLYLAVVGGVGLLRFRWVATTLLAGIVAAAFLVPERVPYFGPIGEAQLLPACFALGALCALHKQSLPLRWQPAAALWLLVAISHEPAFHRFAFYLALFYSSLVVAADRFVVERLRLPFDASYGVYVYGFPVQQSLFAVFPRLGLHANQILAATIATTLGIASWYLVEKPSLLHGRTLVKHLAAVLAGEEAGPPVAAPLRARVASALAALARWELPLLVLLAMAVHALVLGAVFPGHYSPLRPHHSDFYVPVALRHAGMGVVGCLKSPRPPGMLFFLGAGYLGIEGSIAAVIALVFLNCTLTAALLRRVVGIPFSGPFLASFAAFAFLIFSQPFLYGFYTQDAFAHLSYLLLVVGAWILHRHLSTTPRRALGVFAFLAVVAFLAKETFALSALLLGAGWWWTRRRDGPLRAAGPMVATGAALAVALALNHLARSPFIEAPAGAAAPYHVDLSLASVLREWERYSGEAFNPATFTVLVAAIGAIVFVTDRGGARTRIAGLLPAAAVLAWLPNSLLPNHHFAGYSCSGSALLFAPLLVAGPVLASAGGRRRLFAAALTALALVSPAASSAKFAESSWLLAQERIQRNQLRALRYRLPAAPAGAGSEEVLVTGIDFPFSPFDHPLSLAEFRSGGRRRFDVVAYTERPTGALGSTRFLKPSAVDPSRYARVWAFRSDGTVALDDAEPWRLARKPETDDVLQAADLVLYPVLLDTFGVARAADIHLDEQPPARLLICGTKLLEVGEPAIAERCLAASARLDPANPNAHYRLGLAREKLGRTTLARQSVETAIALDAVGAPNASFRETLTRLRGAVPEGPAEAR